MSKQEKKSPFTLPVWTSGWAPIGIDPAGHIQGNLYVPEVTGVKKGKLALFPVQFREPPHGSKGDSRKWILGGNIPGAPPATKVGSKGRKPNLLTQMTRELASRIRNYNASLYRLRRLHFYYENAGGPCPPHNPSGGDLENLPPPDRPEFADLVHKAEVDWATVNSVLTDFLRTARRGYGDKERGENIILVAADMVEVNGYVVSMRLVVNSEKIPDSVMQMSLSSSHTSISSAFSSC